MILKDRKITVRIREWSDLSRMGVPGGYGDSILFGPIANRPSVPDCMDYAVPGHWKYGACGKDVEVWMTAVEGMYCRTDTGESVSGHWIDWKKCDPVPPEWRK